MEYHDHLKLYQAVISFVFSYENTEWNICQSVRCVLAYCEMPYVKQHWPGQRQLSYRSTTSGLFCASATMRPPSPPRVPYGRHLDFSSLVPQLQTPTCTTSRGPARSLPDPAQRATLGAVASRPSGILEHRENFKPVLMSMTPCTWSCKQCNSSSHAAKQTSTFYSANNTMHSKWVWLVLWNCTWAYFMYLFGKGVAKIAKKKEKHLVIKVAIRSESKFCLLLFLFLVLTLSLCDALR